MRYLVEEFGYLPEKGRLRVLRREFGALVDARPEVGRHAVNVEDLAIHHPRRGRQAKRSASDVVDVSREGSRKSEDEE
jgi:hypothetical protein